MLKVIAKMYGMHSKVKFYFRNDKCYKYLRYLAALFLPEKGWGICIIVLV